METKKIELGDVFYVCTNWGICKATITEIIENKHGLQYKVHIDIDENNKDMKYGFYYCDTQLYKSPSEALSQEALKYNIFKLEIKE
jgi:hypothetical protein